MAIASNVPFKLQVIKKFPKEIIQEGTLFSTDEKEVWEKEIITLSIEENDEIEILFDTNDETARLYLDALDIVPLDDRKVMYDSDGQCQVMNLLYYIKEIVGLMHCVLMRSKFPYYVVENGIMVY